MNYEKFKTTTVSSLQQHFGEQAAVSLHSIIKNNNIHLDGLTIYDSSVNISPTLYLNDYYQDYLAGRPFDDVLKDIIEAYQKHIPKESMDFSFFTDYHKVKFQIIYKLINYEQNQILLKDVPHFRFLDLAVVFCCFLPDTPNGAASILIHHSHLKFWNIGAEQLYELATTNTPILLPYTIDSMENTLKSLCPKLWEEAHESQTKESVMMYVLSNSEKLYGASAILYPDVLSYFAGKLNCDFYILPSSIHEVLLLPIQPDTTPYELNCIIRDVNQSHVLKEEILSDHVYIFRQNLGFVTQ